MRLDREEGEPLAEANPQHLADEWGDGSQPNVHLSFVEGKHAPPSEGDRPDFTATELEIWQGAIYSGKCTTIGKFPNYLLFLSERIASVRSLLYVSFGFAV